MPTNTIDLSQLVAGAVIRITNPSGQVIICLVSGQREKGKIWLEYLNTEKAGNRCWIFENETYNSDIIEIITDEKEKLMYFLKS